MKKITIALKHLRKIFQHKYWVFKYCSKCGIVWRGIKHDLSKFSPIEFFESIKYYKGTSSPIDECKRVNGFSYAWMHHKGRNDHHYEYWIDNMDNGGNAIVIPYNCAVEMLCDFLGAGRAYSGKKFTYKGEFEWWLNKLETDPLIHYSIKHFISSIMFNLFVDERDNKGRENNFILSSSHLKQMYEFYTCNTTEEQFRQFIKFAKAVYKEEIKYA